MKVFVVFFCMIIGYACVDSQLAENGEDDLKSNNNAWKADFLYDNETIDEDQYNRSRGDNALAQSADSSSKETEASEKPSSDVKPMTVTSEVKNSGQMAYLAARVMDLWSLLKHSHRNISTANRHSMEVKRSFPRPSAAIRDTDTDSAIKTRRSFRTKRNAARDAKRKKLAAGGGFIEHNVELQILARQFVKLLINQMKVSVQKEGKVIESLEKTGSVPTDVLGEYKTAKVTERELLKVVCDDAEHEDPPEEPEDIVDRYKLFYRDTCFDEYLFDDFRLRQNHPVFFDTPSPALTKYYAMKCREYETIDDYYIGSGPEGGTKDEFGGGASDNSTKPEFECPKKKRESGSVASQMHAQVFTIFLCMVIGILVVDLGLQQLEIGEDDLKANKNARKVKRRFPRTDRIGSAEI